MGDRVTFACLCAQVEQLERRRLFATINWDGGPDGNGNDFLDPVNWAGDVLPSETDSAVLGVTGANPAITISGKPAVQIVSTSRRILITGGTISGGTWTFNSGSSLTASDLGGKLENVQATTDIFLDSPNASITVTGTTLFGPVHLRAANTTFKIGPDMWFNTSITAEGTASGQRNVVLGAGGPGSVKLFPFASFRLAPNCGGNLVISDDSPASLENNGVITADAANRTLTVQNAMLVNHGTVQSRAGTINVRPTNWVHEGMVNVTTGATATLGGNWQQTTGAIAVSNGTLNLGGAFNGADLDPERFTRLNGTVNLTGTIDNMASTLTLNANTGSWNLLGGTINKGALVFSGGAALTPTPAGGTLADVAISGGDLMLNQTNAAITLADTTTFPAARLVASGATLNLAAGYVLNSLISVEGAAAGERFVNLATTAAGTVTIGPNGTVRLASNSGGNLMIGEAATATLVNHGLIEVLARTINVTAHAVVMDGSSYVSGSGLLHLDNLSSDGSVTIDTAGQAMVSRFRTSSLTINGHATLALNGAPDEASIVCALAFGVAGTLDLNDNDVILDYAPTDPSPRGAIQALINAARNGGDWNGTSSVASTAARNANPRNTTLALLEATDYKSIYGAAATFDGLPLDNSMVLVKYTYYGDSDFNSVLNFDDYSRIDAGFNNGRTGWLNGDFDGNDVVDFDDYALIDLAFNTQSIPLTSRASGHRFSDRRRAGA